MSTLAGKVALVTGGSRGIGAAVVRQLARRGATVAFTYSTAADRAAAVARDIEASGAEAMIIQADGADPAAAVAAVDRTVQDLGRLDILVNNAGIFSGGTLDEIGLDDLDRILAVDVRAVFLTAQAAARHMTHGGRIINIGTSLAERVPGPTLTLYAMCKASLVGLTKGLARDLGHRGITVTLVQPGPIDTDMNPKDGPSADMLTQVTALGRFGNVEDIAGAVDYLAGDGGRYITGTALTVDGGFAA